VAKDRTITLNGKLYEVPIPLIGKHILVLYHDNQPQRVEAFYERKSYGLLTPVDLHINCRVKRNWDYGTDVVEISENAQKYQGGKLWSKGGDGQ
jgi:hypothetical protein